jgi:hypothetical protein
VGGEATQVREAELAGLTAQRMDRGRGPPIAERAVVHRRRVGQAELMTPRCRPGWLEVDDGLVAERAGAHVRAL